MWIINKMITRNYLILSLKLFSLLIDHLHFYLYWWIMALYGTVEHSLFSWLTLFTRPCHLEINSITPKNIWFTVLTTNSDHWPGLRWARAQCTDMLCARDPRRNWAPAWDWSVLILHLPWSRSRTLATASDTRHWPPVTTDASQ